MGESLYLGDYLGNREELEAWMQTQVEAWYHMVSILGKMSMRNPHLEYSGLGMSLHLKWQYLKITVPGVGTLMGPNK